MKRIDETAREIAEVLISLGIPYALMGGMAVRVHGLPRPTFDVDFTIAIDRDNLPEFYDRVEVLGYTIPEVQRRGWVDSVRGMGIVKVQLPDEELLVDVDLFLAETDYQKEVLHRRQHHQSGEFSAWFVSAEDLILLKLLASRPKDLADVADVLFIQGHMDEIYLRRWAKSLGILDCLETALQQFDES